MSAPPQALLLVFTDLDGSLLDHYDYSYRDALPLLRRLEQLEVPVIPTTSKTRAEIEHLRAQLGSEAPFIVENGAAVYIPCAYFDAQPPGTLERDGYWVRELGAPRAQWLRLLAELEAEFDGEFEYFYRAGTPGIMRMTSLSAERAREANQREYSEPVQWLGSHDRRGLFLERLRAGGAAVLQGGRFLSVAGDCDKGRALRWLRVVYQSQHPARSIHDLAAGDSDNDRAMLEAAETALLVRSPVHDFPALQRDSGVLRSSGYGPAGWSEGVLRWLQGYPLQV